MLRTHTYIHRDVAGVRSHMRCRSRNALPDPGCRNVPLASAASCEHALEVCDASPALPASNARASSHPPAGASAAFVVAATAAAMPLVSLPDAPSPCCFAAVPERLSSPRPAAAPSPPPSPAEEVTAFVPQPPTPELGAGTTRGDALIFASAKRGVLAGSPCFSSDPPIFNPERLCLWD